MIAAQAKAKGMCETMQRLLIFGDSNTHGTEPGSALGRYGPETRWCESAARDLGADWRLIDEGLPGRTTQVDDPVMGAHMNGQRTWMTALASHAPLDIVAIMLGTNDLKARFGADAERIAAGIEGLIAILRAQSTSAWLGSPQLLVIAPAPVNVTGARAAEWHGSQEKSIFLSDAYRALAERHGAAFLDAGEAGPVDPDEGIHWTAAGHAAISKLFVAAVWQMAITG